MATKPSSVPTWATFGADIAEPTTGRKELGHVHGESPTAQEENWFKNLVYQWAAYLRDGAFTGNHTFGGTVGITGATTLTGLATCNGGALIPSGQTLDVNGVVDFAGATSLKFPARTKQLDVSAGQVIIGNGSVVAGFAASVTPTAFVVPVHIDVGDRITGIRVYYERNSGSTVGLSLVEVALATDVASNLVVKNIASGTGAANTDLQTSPTSGSLPQTITAARTYRVRCDISNTDKIVGIELTYDRP